MPFEFAPLQWVQTPARYAHACGVRCVDWNWRNRRIRLVYKNEALPLDQRDWLKETWFIDLTAMQAVPGFHLQIQASNLNCQVAGLRLTVTCEDSHDKTQSHH